MTVLLLLILVLFTTTIMFLRYYGEFGMPDLWNFDVDVDVVVGVGVGHPKHHSLSLFLKVIFPRYYGEFGMPDLWNHTNCPDPCLTYSCPKVFIYSTKIF